MLEEVLIQFTTLPNLTNFESVSQSRENKNFILSYV